MEDLNLLSNHEYDGYWWTAGCQEKYPGKLVLSPDNIKLSMFSSTLDFGYYSEYSSEKNGFIYGETIEGIKLTLFSAFTVKTKRYGNDEKITGYRINIISNRCVVGSHISSLSSTMEYDVYVGLDGLDDWFCYFPYHRSHEKQGDGRIEKMEWESDRVLIDCYIPSLNARLSSFHPIDLHVDYSKSIQLFCKSFLILKSEHGKSLLEIFDFLHDIARLWSLLCGIITYPTCITLRRFEPGTEIQYDPTICLYIPIGKDHTTNNSHSRHFITNYDLTKNNIANIVDKWFDAADESKAIRGLFFKSFRNHQRRRYDLTQFLNYISAIEIFAREHDVSSIISKSEAKQLRSDLEIVIREKIREDAQEALIAKLAFLHAPTLRDRLNGIAINFNELTREFFQILDASYIQKLVSTRNYYTHYDKKSNKKDKIISDDELPDVIDQLAMIIILLLLKDLGFDEGEILPNIRDSWTNGHI